MDPLPIIALVVISTLFGFAWHNQPARAESSVSGDASASSPIGHVNWGMVLVWSLVFLSCAAFFIAGYITWAKPRGGWETLEQPPQPALAQNGLSTER